MTNPVSRGCREQRIQATIATLRFRPLLASLALAVLVAACASSGSSTYSKGEACGPKGEACAGKPEPAVGPTPSVRPTPTVTPSIGPPAVLEDGTPLPRAGGDWGLRDLSIVFGRDAECPARYDDRIPQDLNQGAGGEWIWGCAGYGYGRNGAITDVNILLAESPSVPCRDEGGRTYHKVDADLNKGVGGAYIYLCVTRDPYTYRDDDTGREYSSRVAAFDFKRHASYRPYTCAYWDPPVDVYFSGGQSLYYGWDTALPNPNSWRHNDGWYSSAVSAYGAWGDLNAGAEGDYIYTCLYRVTW